MGMKKSKVAFGLLSEVVMITVACLIIGMCAGIVTAQRVSDVLLDNQIKQIEESGGNNMGFGPNGPIRTSGGGNVAMGMRIGNPMGGSPAEALKEMDVSMDVRTIMEIIIISLLLALTASVVGIVNVTRYEPMRILTERN